MLDLPLVVVIDTATLAAFTRPVLDLQTGQIIELAQPVDPVQLELPLLPVA